MMKIEKNVHDETTIDALKDLQHVQSVEEYFKVTKSNTLVEAAQQLTSNEFKVTLVVISLINPDDEKFKIYRVNVRTIQEILQNLGNTSFYNELKKMTFSLMTKPFKYREIYKDKKGNEKTRELQANWFSSCEYFDGEGYVEFCFDPKITKHLLKLRDNFTTYKLGYAMRLKSVYSIRLYEICKKVQFLKSVLFELSELRRLLGIEENEYKQYFDFKKRIIEVAKNELKEKTDISFTYKEFKTGRKIDKLKITIKEIKTNVIEKTDIDLFGLNPLGYELIKYGVSENQARDIIKSRDSKYIKEKIEQLEYLLNNYPNKIKGTASYLYNSIIDDWNNNDFINYKLELKKNELKKQNEKEIRKRKQLQKEYEQFVNNRILNYEDFDEKKKHEIDKIVENELIKIKSISSKFLSEETILDLKKDMQQEVISKNFSDLPKFDEWMKMRDQNMLL